LQKRRKRRRRNPTHPSLENPNTFFLAMIGIMSTRGEIRDYFTSFRAWFKEARGEKSQEAGPHALASGALQKSHE
jgi:hypothetical protein